jgi:hypothetical protein
MPHANVIPVAVNVMVTLSVVTGTSKVALPSAPVVSPVSDGSSSTVKGCDARSASMKQIVTGAVGGCETNVLELPGVSDVPGGGLAGGSGT